MQVQIKKAVPADMPAVLALIRELASYEKAPEQVKLSEETLIRDAAADPPCFHCLIARSGEEILGFCLSWFRYSTWRGRLLYVEDLYVREIFRRKGIGKMLLDEMLQYAADQRIGYVHLQVLDWNQPAIDFYRKYYEPEFDNTWINVLIPVSAE